MAIHVALHHKTSYTYDRPVMLGPQLVRLRPAPHARTPIVSYSLKVQPEGFFLNWQQDPDSNYLARLVFPEPVREFVVEVDLVAELAVFNPFDFFLEPHANEFPFAYDETSLLELAPFMRRDVLSPKFEALLKSVDRTKRATINFLVDLNQRVGREVRYIIRPEPGVQTPEETLTLGRGSCRDSAILLVQLLRHLGLAARFVSGYLVQLRADQKSLDGPSGTEKDFTDLHAWTEVYLPGAGWIGLDATSGMLAGEGHIPLACSPEPLGAAPITGTAGPCESTFAFAMSVQRFREAPRVTLPYTDEKWAAIDALGEKVDARLLAGDVRLTMGGEPTFVSIDDMDGAEWNTLAQGPDKRRLAERLIKKLWEHYATGGFIHYGQGKWYPGEPLPRWAFACFWRTDGEPIWQNPALLADISVAQKCTAVEAETFIAALATRLEVEQEFIMPAFEDAWYYAWKERKLPSNVDPLKNQLRSVEDRNRMAQVFEQGLDHIVGYVLPLKRSEEEMVSGWQSSRWYLRTAGLFLVPGDSAMGFRLPLDSQPWIAPKDADFGLEPDPQVDRPPLPSGRIATAKSSGAAAKAAARKRVKERGPKVGESATWITRTALCVEAREGHVFVFLPPIDKVEDYLELIAAIEAAAAELKQPIILEGYLPPHDARLSHIKVTPDPGVIEVNVAPSARWRELVEKTETLYSVARECRLGTEKFMIDGRHTGTGGGNHIVVGGETPADSPFLRRPQLLQSLISYWIQHPSLSYLFSGLFIGPTSQSPRVDEARNDAVYELEIANRELTRLLAQGKEVAPWLVDRIYRNLLVDVTGNTHRAEFCIDKLYTPEGGSGRLGLLELRAFEMPPHARMSLTQQLLLRAFIARFWDEPYRPRRLARWGTDLHDRFMLPHYVQQDFAGVIEDLQDHDLPFEFDWFAAHFEFRFPFHGRATFRGVEMELRHALEPWHVLGEEGAMGATVRFVDSSVERVQLKVTGLVPERYVVACNGVRVPLQPTGVNGEFVAGVRFRAWRPPNCLHPTIEVNAPLVFDLVDTWNRRSLGGFQYHVAHPAGRNYTTFPVNANEAESRRLARFFAFGHTPGQRLAELPREVAPELPHTLDLRDPARVAR